MATTTARVTPRTHNPSISAQTVCNRPREAGLRACPHQTSPATTLPMGTNTLFTDKSRFCLTRGDGRIRIYCQRNERYTEACTLEWDRFGVGWSIMVWGGVSQHHRTEHVVIAGNLNAVHYREDILFPHVVPFLQAHPDMTL